MASAASVSDPIRVSDAQRRARLVARHHLGRTAADVVDVVRGMVALHSSDPATPYLSVRARLAGFETADLDRALYADRTLWRLHAMRRTMFVVPTDRGAVFEAGASRDVARKERRRIERWLEAEMEPERVPDFMAALEERVLEELAASGEAQTTDLTAAIPELGTEITVGSGKWTTRSPLSSRLLFLLAMDARLVRTHPAGSWRSSQYHWAVAGDWFGRPPQPLEPGPARVDVARQYLTAFGPATLRDLRWWTGWTAKQTAAALDELGPVSARLDGGDVGLLLPDDVDPVPAASATALLPGLDPTPMGWKDRDWFLGPHAEPLFDTNGNIGPSVWVDGRIVGGWAQRPDGEVVVRLLDDVGEEARGRVDEEAAGLTAWLDGTVVTPRFPTPLERELRSSGH